MATNEEIHELSLAMILESNPQLVQECSNLTDEFLCGMTTDQYKRLRLQEMLQKEARRNRMDAWSFQLKLAEDAGLDVSRAKEQSRRDTAKAIGLEDLL